MSFNYSRGPYRGDLRVACFDCAIDYVGSDADMRMQEHCRRTGHGVSNEAAGQTIKSFMATAKPVSDVIITLCYLCWNTREASVEGAEALVKEGARLDKLGCLAVPIILDNGSTDNTFEGLCTVLGEDVPLFREQRNVGISAARNVMIQYSLDIGANYILLMDGDIEVVPLSVYTMMRYLECHPEVGCIGAYAASCSPDRHYATTALMEIPESRVKGDIKCAWTQYGLFRASMFKDGILFDTAGPFGEPGWGFEDDDLCFQMERAGWENKYFNGMCYLHRNLRSSWPNLEADGVDIAAMFNKRKEYLLNKWSGLMRDSGTLNGVRAQQLPAR